MIRLKKRIAKLESDLSLYQREAKKALEAGRISHDEYQYFIENEGMSIPPIAWVDDVETPQSKYKEIGQKIGVLPNYTWA